MTLAAAFILAILFALVFGNPGEGIAITVVLIACLFLIVRVVLS